ncbi:MAG: hypothetical protein KDJ65_01315 [Anaerolineae bacterium]|nr:hypothetical protein [Anaerolineae bacterium]
MALKIEYQVREQLQELLNHAGFNSQVELTSAHLTEIEQEVVNFLDQLTAFRSHARHQDTAAAQECLVEISLALQHMADHIQAVVPILDEGLDIADDA